MSCRRSVIHFAGVSLSCTSPYSPSFFRHDEEILGHDQEHPDRWRHGFATHRAGQSLLGESYFPVAVAFGRSAAVCNTSHSLADQHAAPFALRAWWRKAASPPFGGRNTRLGISRYRCQEFRHDEIFRDRDSDLQRCSWSLPEPCSRSNRITTTITTDTGMVTRR